MSRKSLSIIMLLLFIPAAVAQKRAGEVEQLGVADAPLNCEMNMLFMDLLSKMTLEQSKAGGVLVAVARLGDGERSREFNRRRLYNVRESIKDRTGVEAGKVVVAEGERAKGFGRIEFYLGGRMVGGLLLKRAGDLCLLCREEEGPYYPHKDNIERKRGKK